MDPGDKGGRARNAIKAVGIAWDRRKNVRLEGADNSQGRTRRDKGVPKRTKPPWRDFVKASGKILSKVGKSSSNVGAEGSVLSDLDWGIQGGMIVAETQIVDLMSRSD